MKIKGYNKNVESEIKFRIIPLMTGVSAQVVSTIDIIKGYKCKN